MVDRFAHFYDEQDKISDHILELLLNDVTIQNWITEQSVHDIAARHSVLQITDDQKDAHDELICMGQMRILAKALGNLISVL